MMSALPESSSPKWGLYCEPCDYIHFSTYNDWQIHHLRHLRQPVVRLVKLNPKLCSKLLQGRSYKLNTGVARSSQHNVPPLKISLIKQQGANNFTVKREDNSASWDCFNCESRIADSDLESTAFKSTFAHQRPSDVEGKDLLERLGASFSISRRGKASPANATNTSSASNPYNPSNPSNLSNPSNSSNPSNASNASNTANSSKKAGSPVPDGKKENILERLSGIGGISVSTTSKSPSTDSKLVSGISISSKTKPIELSQLKTLKNQVLDNDKKAFDKNKILEKLSGSGLISIASKPGVKEGGKEWKVSGGKGEGEAGAGSPKPEPLERLGGSSSRSSKSDDSNDSSDSKMSGESRTSQVNAGEENGKTVNENSNGVEQKKFVRVKQSSFSKKSIRPERQGSLEEASEEKAIAEEGKEKGSVPEETGIDILERLTENLNNTVGVEKCAEAPNSSESSSAPAEDPLATGREIDEFNTNVNASESECPEETPESEFPALGEKNLPEQQEVQSLLLIPPSSSGQDGENSNYSTISQSQQESFGEHNNVSPEHAESNENPVSFSRLSNDDPSEGQGEQQTAFWSDIQNSSNSVDQPQEDPLLTPENSVPNGDTNFLHNFSNDYQTGTSNLPPENSEFMSLDRLGQTQHQQSPYAGDASSPMEHLSQQVQRIPNPTPQINVISRHHLQVPPPPPPPPQLHTGVPLSPQHISPQQANSYDALHMQQPMPPPPLYQGYMFNQSYPPQPQMPRPPQPQMPMLQQRPHIPARTFQPMPVPQQRPRPRPAVKRSPIRPPQEVASKQPRMSSLQAVRPQVANTTTKLPSGITITPPKKTLEANKVANVLASRGITVTPSRQTSQGIRPQQQRTQSGSSALNISSAVSITPNQGRTSGGFAVPSPRRSAPIVNHSAERPERCMTVDLTQDDDFPQSQSRRGSTAGRFSCNLCGKAFGSSPALATHKAHHRNNFPFKCDLCSAEYSNMTHLMNHRQTCHKKAPVPDLAIPIVDLNHPGARDQLRKCGVYNFIPLAQLQSNNNGYFGVPIIQLDTAKEKAVSNLSLLGAGNILVLGKMKAITTQTSH